MDEPGSSDAWIHALIGSKTYCLLKVLERRIYLARLYQTCADVYVLSREPIHVADTGVEGEGDLIVLQLRGFPSPPGRLEVPSGLW